LVFSSASRISTSTLSAKGLTFIFFVSLYFIY